MTKFDMYIDMMAEMVEDYESDIEYAIDMLVNNC